MKKALIDTNIISAFMRGDPSVIQKTEKYLHFHKHGWGMEDPRGQNPKRWMIRRVLAGFVKEFTCVSRQMVPWLEADIRVGRPVTQIYNGIDTQRYRPGSGIEPGTGTKDRPKVIGVIGRLDPIKDHPTLFRAFAQVARSMPDIRLMVIGDGPERQKLEARADRRPGGGGNPCRPCQILCNKNYTGGHLPK